MVDSLHKDIFTKIKEKKHNIFVLAKEKVIGSAVRLVVHRQEQARVMREIKNEAEESQRLLIDSKYPYFKSFILRLKEEYMKSLVHNPTKETAQCVELLDIMLSRPNKCIELYKSLNKENNENG